MRLRLLILHIAVSVGVCCAQQHTPAFKSNIISVRKVIMHYNGEKDSLLIPVVSDKYPQLKKALSEQVIFDGDSLSTVISDYESDGHGITEVSYEISYENKDIISIKLYYESYGAHPNEYWRWLTLNVQTGEPYPISNEINITGLKWIYHTYKTRLKESVIADRRGRRKDGDYKKNKEVYDGAFGLLDKAIDTLSFKNMFSSYVFNKKGITFTTEGVLPHFIRVLEPGRNWFVPFAKLKKYKTATALILNKALIN